MTKLELSNVLEAAFEAAYVADFPDQSQIMALEDGQDIALSQFDIDSFGMMELCITIEVRTGVSIVPAELSKVKTIKELMNMIEARVK